MADEESKVLDAKKEWEDKAEKFTFLARVADNAGQTEAMLEYIRQYCAHKNTLAKDFLGIVKAGAEFPIDYTLDERELITSCCKSYIAKCKDAYANFKIIRQRETYQKDKSIFDAYAAKFQFTIKERCKNVINTLAACSPAKEDMGSLSHQAKAFFLLLRADFHRYIAETFETDKEEHPYYQIAYDAKKNAY